MSSVVVDETMSSPSTSAVKAASGMPVLSASASTAAVNSNGVGDNAATGTYEKQRTLSMSLSTASAPTHHPHQPSLAMAPAAFAQLSPQQQQQYYQQPQQQQPASFRPAASTDALTDNMDKLKITQQLQQQQLLQQSSSATQPQATAQPAPVADASSATVSSSSSSASSSSASSSSGGGSGSSSNKGKQVKSISYAAERVIGNGSFGVVYQASVIETGETVAIKKVLQDRRFKNRELQIMGMLDHPDVITLRHCFYSKGEKPDEIYLNLVMEYIPETIYRTIRNHTKAGKLLPIILTKIYMFQILRSVAYIHSIGVSHRDIKPQNLLLNSKTHQVKLCDFGSAKMLVPGEPNVSYICSRYYRAPELVFEATQYSCAIDIWSVGCVFAEMMLGTPLFPGESGVDQLIEIIKILGTPSREEIHAMNPNHQSFKFPQIKSHPWPKVFRGKAPDAACDLVAAFLKYDPKGRLDPLDALAHEFFDELRDINAKLPNGKPVPNIFNFTENELRLLQQRGCLNKVVPKHVVSSLKWPADVTPPNTN